MINQNHCYIKLLAILLGIVALLSSFWSCTNTPEPTSTPIIQPSPTNTPKPEPTATDTPEPSSTPFIESTTTESTSTIQPSPTNTSKPEPTATNTPEPPPSSSPEHTAIKSDEIEEPTATSQIEVSINEQTLWSDLFPAFNEEELRCIQNELGAETFQTMLDQQASTFVTGSNPGEEVYSILQCLTQQTAAEMMVAAFAMVDPSINIETKNCIRKLFSEVDIVKFLSLSSPDALNNEELQDLSAATETLNNCLLKSFSFMDEDPSGQLIWQYNEQFAQPRILDGDMLFVETSEGDLHALEKNTGDLLWKHDLDEGFAEMPVSLSVTDDIIYATSEARSTLYAIAKNSGRFLWSYDSYGGIESDITISDGNIYFWEDQTILQVLDSSTGKSLWQYNSPCYPYHQPAIVKGLIYIGFCDEELHIIDAANGAPVRYNGELIWKDTTTYVESISRLLTNGLSYSIYRDGISAHDALTGEYKWSYETDDHASLSAQVVDDIIYIWSINGPLIFALSTSSGELLWEYLTSSHISAITVANGIIYLATSQAPNLYALNALTGEFIWQFEALNPIYLSPIVSDGIVYITPSDSRIYALDTSTGELIWSYILGYSAQAKPIIEDGIAYIGEFAGISAIKGP